VETAIETAPSDAQAVEKLITGRARVETELAKVIVGQKEVVEQILLALFSGGHCLITGAPGLAKTLLVKSIAQIFHLQFQRIQFTPDLMPADITGTEILSETEAGRRMTFVKGPVFANMILADEINRTPPKTQSALLEAMQEHQVTASGVRHALPEPFFVLATQNPIEMEGTYPLPEAQRDRFTARIALGYPSPEAELSMIDSHGLGSPLDELEPVSDDLEIAKCVSTVRTVHLSDSVRRYAVDLVTASRRHPDLRLGASPRATLHLLRAARAAAALDERDYVLPDDLQSLAEPVLAHRLLPSAEAQIARRDAAAVVADLIATVPVPNLTTARR
jgi:MoxR-like ATPase